MEISELTPEEQEKLNMIRQKRILLKKDIEALKNELQEITAQIDSLDVPAEGEDPLVKKMNIGKKKFNIDPKKGMEFLFENNLVERTPEAVAKFFYQQENLNKKAIGDYIGDISKDFNLKVLEEFTNLFDFAGVDFLMAFRQYLMGFHLPGESQKIDKIVSVFSERYYELNSTEFTNDHECFVLSYAIILLNTLMHNANAKLQEGGLKEEKTFVGTMLNYDDKCNFSEALIRKCYNDIKAEPLKTLLNDGDDLIAAYSNPVKEGWLFKLGGRVKSWKRRWFILNDQCLFYFVSPDRGQAKGIIPLDNICIRKVQEKTKENCFELYSSDNQTIKACKTDKEGVIVAGKHREYRMSAATPAERDEWFKAIQESIGKVEITTPSAHHDILCRSRLVK